jgi:ribonuclease P protein component
VSRCFHLPRGARVTEDEAIVAFRTVTPEFRGQWLTIRRVSNGRGFARLLIRVAKRHQRSAVERNRIRRSIKESFRLQRSRLPAADYSVALRAPVPAGTAAKVRLEFERLLGLDK